jgi:hypothetical protein
MTETLVSSASKEVRIGFDRPFVIIGERINPTGRKILAEEMSKGDYSRVEADAIAQVQAGAHMLDVNAGIPLADEPNRGGAGVRLVGVPGQGTGQLRDGRGRAAGGGAAAGREAWRRGRRDIE